MPNPPQMVQLSWIDPTTQEPRQPSLALPITFGRRLEQMPETIGSDRVSRMVLLHSEVSRYHALISWENNQLVLTDQNTANGTIVNGARQQRCVLNRGDRIQLGPVSIQVLQLPTGQSSGQSSGQPPGQSTQQATRFESPTIYPDTPASTPPLGTTRYTSDPILPDEGGISPTPSPAPQRASAGSPTQSSFPPASFRDAQVVSVQALEQSGHFQRGHDEVPYAALGAGLGSYIWVDYLRICGVKPHQIVALGTQSEPYAKYKQLCLNSQIPLHERLRSNSDSCPDNIWGWPSYALREAWSDFQRGKVDNAMRYMWQVFGEPTLVETYTPRANNVFDSIDREARRISWPDIYRYGSIRSIRKTDDGRYAVAYSKGRGEYGYLVAKYVHLATGYPGIRFLKHLQDYRDKHNDPHSVVNAYEQHDHVYEHLSRHGGRAIVQGRGIVASRILQRLDEVRRTSRQTVEVIHLMRSPKQPHEGNRFGWSQRPVKNHWEFQPFNWPKACWGGDLRDWLEKADPTERQQLMKSWGGTTTADRKDWQELVSRGLAEGWYRVVFGTVQSVTNVGGQLQVTYDAGQSSAPQQATQSANFIVDATGLSAAVTENPLLKDLIERYQLPLINKKSLKVSNEFEITSLASSDVQYPQRPNGRMYAAGVTTLGGPYAAVDSFLGLQYAALRTVTHLTHIRAEGLRPLGVGRSGSQWLRWVMNQTP
ncbi:MAG: FHA domain-containing protein [Cyanobacteria bacterium J06621_3]